MAFTLVAALLALLLLAGMLACLLAGHRLGRRLPAGTAGDPGALDAAVFGLFGLLVAFTFSGASARFEARRDLVVQEANAIGTAWLLAAQVRFSSRRARGPTRETGATVCSPRVEEL